MSVLNGDPTDPTLYPAVFYFIAARNCTATLVASRTMVTASHCLADNTPIFARIPAGSKNWIPGDCYHAKAESGPSPDFAVCILKGDAPGPFERINSKPDLIDPAKKPEVMIAGYGCGEDKEPKPPKPIFRTGLTNVVDYVEGALITKDRAALCLGDSGGPTFLETKGGDRIQIGVGSQRVVDAKETSRLTPTSHPVAVAAVRQRSSQLICGFDKHAHNCR